MGKNKVVGKNGTQMIIRGIWFEDTGRRQPSIRQVEKPRTDLSLTALRRDQSFDIWIMD